MKRGALITIEGTDYSGKETQSKLLIKRFGSEGIPCKTMSFPRYDTPTGRIIGQCYLGKKRSDYQGDSAWFGEADSVPPMVASLYFAADRLAARDEIEETLDSGKNLILDRYVYSNVAHQAGKAKTTEERSELIHTIANLELNLLKLPKPSLTVFLYIPLEVAQELKKGRSEVPDGHEANLEHLRRAEETYLLLDNLNNPFWKRVDCAPDKTINSLKTPEQIHQEVYNLAKKTIEIHS